jgi:hypothetical protein
VMREMPSDLERARLLLIGYVNEGKGRMRTRHLPEGEQADQARRAMARLLRSDRPLDRELREHLADLFDPPAWQQRKIVFKFLHRGKSIDHIANTQVVSHVQDELRARKRMRQAIKSAAEKFSISETRVKKVWSTYRRAYGGSLKAALGVPE